MKIWYMCVSETLSLPTQNKAHASYARILYTRSIVHCRTLFVLYNVFVCVPIVKEKKKVLLPEKSHSKAQNGF